jgi:GxxExxY protein
MINNTLLVDLKAKSIVTKDDYYQMNRYLQASGLKLGLIVNFRNRYLKPIRVVNSKL